MSDANPAYMAEIFVAECSRIVSMQERVTNPHLASCIRYLVKSGILREDGTINKDIFSKAKRLSNEDLKDEK